ncbi:MAG: hypothetical protein RQ847_00275 [Wenzhouxiangellaceae bacterium]|nr:hypothetical protein [Wenzhouxiangellaceae bacterium]
MNYRIKVMQIIEASPVAGQTGKGSTAGVGGVRQVVDARFRACWR